MSSRTGGLVQPEPPAADLAAPVAKLFERVAQATSLSSVAARIVRLLDEPSPRPDALLQTVSEDPGMTARVLRRVNSACYNHADDVNNLESAIERLGVGEVVNLALTVFAARMFQSPGEYRSFSRDGLWAHSVAVAAVSKLVAKVCQQGSPDDAYVAGLFHDLGYLLMDQHLQRYFHRVLNALDKSAATTSIERRLLGFDHAQLGAHIARHWQLPPRIIAAIRQHHDPAEPDGEPHPLTHIVALADYLCSRAGITSLGLHNLAPPPDEVYAGLQLDKAHLRAIWQELRPTLSRAQNLASA